LFSCKRICLGWDEQHHNLIKNRHFQPQFLTVVSDGIPILIYAKYGLLWRRRDAGRRFTGLIFVTSLGSSCLNKNFCRRREDRHRDARRLFAITSNGVSRLLLPWFGIQIWRCYCRSRLQASCMTFLCSPTLYVEFCIGVPTMYVVTLRFSLSASFLWSVEAPLGLIWILESASRRSALVSPRRVSWRICLSKLVLG
jgi:hypothetical protein